MAGKWEIENITDNYKYPESRLSTNNLKIMICIILSSDVVKRVLRHKQHF